MKRRYTEIELHACRLLGTVEGIIEDHDEGRDPTQATMTLLREVATDLRKAMKLPERVV